MRVPTFEVLRSTKNLRAGGDAIGSRLLPHITDTTSDSGWRHRWLCRYSDTAKEKGGEEKQQSVTSTKTQVTMFEILQVGGKLNYFLNISTHSNIQLKWLYTWIGVINKQSLKVITSPQLHPAIMWFINLYWPNGSTCPVRYTDNSYIPSIGLRMSHVNDVKSETIEFSGQTRNIYLRSESSAMLCCVIW